jgi:hypothetical protein
LVFSWLFIYLVFAFIVLESSLVFFVASYI